MAQSLGSLMVDIGANVAMLQRDMNKASSVVERSAKNMGKMFGTAVAGMVSYQTIQAATEAFLKQDNAIKQLEARLQSTGGVVGYTSKELQDMASSLQSVTRFGDEATIEMQSLLLTFTSVRGGVFRQAVESIQDMATAMAAGNGGTPDLKAAAIQVGKALNDPVKGVSALAEAGIQFTTAQKSTIQSLIESNRLYDAQQIILKELQTQFGGAARAAGDRSGLGAALNGVAMAAGDALEQVGSSGNGFVGSLNELEDLLSSGEFNSQLESIAKSISSIGIAAAYAIKGVGSLSENLNTETEFFAEWSAGRLSLMDLVTTWSTEGMRNKLNLLRPDMAGVGFKMPDKPITLPAVTTTGTASVGAAGSGKEYDELVKAMERLSAMNMANETAQLEQNVADLDGVFLAMSDTLLPLNNSFDKTVASLRLMSTDIPNAEEAVKQFTYTTDSAFDEMQNAIQNFGDVFTYTIADALTTGKLEWEDYTKFVLNSLARMAIQEGITKPAFNWVGSVVSSLFGGVDGARAAGGPVVAGSTYLVGEQGPELFTPKTSGMIIPNGASPGGGGVVQQITIDARGATPGMEAKIRQAAEQGARMGYEMVKADIDRRGPIRKGLGG